MFKTNTFFDLNFWPLTRVKYSLNRSILFVKNRAREAKNLIFVGYKNSS